MGIKTVAGVNDMATTHPELASQLLHPEEGAKYMAGTTHRFEWVCSKDPRHVWEAPGVKRVAGQGCPYCAGRRVLPGVNDLATMRPDLAAELVRPEEGREVTVGSSRKLEWQCSDVPEHRWTASVDNRAKGKGCPYCSGRNVLAGSNDLATTRPDLAAELADPEDGKRLTEWSNQKVSWVCSKDSRHKWDAVVASRSKGAGCPICSNQLIVPGINTLDVTHPELAALCADEDDAHRLSVGSHERVAWRCTKGEDHVWYATPSQALNGGVRCSVCSGRQVSPGINDLATVRPDLAAQLVDADLATRLRPGSNQKVLWQCPEDPTHQWVTSVNERTGHGTGCPFCWQGKKESSGERELADAVSLLVGDGVEVVMHDRSVLGGKELDVYVPSLAVAFEFNGTFWHSERWVADKGYHTAKLDACAEAGVRLVSVWEDDWTDRHGACIAMVAAKLGALGNAEALDQLGVAGCGDRVDARSCDVRRVSGHEAEAFLDAHHIQGAVRATLHLGLVDADGTLRAVLSVRDAKGNARCRREAGTWDVQRYATCGIVRGGFSKLLSHVERIIASDPEGRGWSISRWLSFADRGVSDGGLYKRCGFHVDAVLKPDYRYVGDVTGWRRTPKERFQKKRFRDDLRLSYEEGWTESQAAEANGLWRIWDAGKLRMAKDVA